VHENFLEVETPIMTPIPGMEPHLTPFETNLVFQNLADTATPLTNSIPAPISSPISSSIPSPKITQPTSASKTSFPVYLNTSPELQMKKLLGSPEGFDKIFNITKVFRNGEMNSPLHNPEFTMLEWYRKNADYKDLMTDCENLILSLVQNNRSESAPGRKPKIKNKLSQDTSPTNTIPIHTLSYQSHTVDLSTPWPRFTTNELFKKYCGIDLLANKDFETFKKTANEFAKKQDLKNFPASHHTSDTASAATASATPFHSGCENWDDLYFKIFLNYIEPEIAKLNTPIFIYDYPSSQAALAKRSAQNTFFAERFELYIKGIELANAFSELIDSKEQRARLLEEQNLRRTLGKTVLPIDEEFLTALSKITTPTAGIALGLDRLIMFLLNKKSIDEVLLFPMTEISTSSLQHAQNQNGFLEP